MAVTAGRSHGGDGIEVSAVHEAGARRRLLKELDLGYGNDLACLLREPEGSSNQREFAIDRGCRGAGSHTLRRIGPSIRDADIRGAAARAEVGQPVVVNHALRFHQPAAPVQPLVVYHGLEAVSQREPAVLDVMFSPRSTAASRRVRILFASRLSIVFVDCC